MKELETRNNIANSRIQQMIGELAVGNASLQADVDVLTSMVQERDVEIAKLRLEISELKEKDNEKMETEREPYPTEEPAKQDVPRKK